MEYLILFYFAVAICQFINFLKIKREGKIKIKAHAFGLFVSSMLWPLIWFYLAVDKFERWLLH